jgi:hypothetical protein
MSTSATARSVLRAALLAIVVAGALSAVWVAAQAAWVDVQLLQVRWQTGQWRSGSVPLPSIVDWGKARNTLADALTQAPEDPQIHEALGYLYAIRAQSAVQLPTLYQPLMQQAQTSYRTAARLRPMSGATWANVALASHLLDAPQGVPSTPSSSPSLTVLWDAFDRALLYGEREPYVQRTVAEIGFSRWAQLAPDRRTALLAMVSNAWPENRPALVRMARVHGRSEVADVK